MSFLQKESVQRAEKFLKEFDSNLNVISLATSARTAADAANSLKCEVGAIVKSLLFSADDKFILCLVSGDKKASLNKLKKRLDIKNMEMAKVEDVKEVTGYTIGGVSPVGHLKKIDIYIDKNLDRFKELYAAAGHPNCVFKIDFKNLVQITDGSILDITE
ncbi:YbaK/EbsC family protein [Candidatus Pelagibacter sp. HIMB1321]|uniref:YbaK/EbsC family protein n=1 Tax=Candidatus Pelagibacter sp. HIMB1321 TaxID=1388755 RepID=UPI000A07F8D3|nr:YbaK/EbsC family protein [Candidatus Pelagibacter sp. HIMB1321]SMF72732.1 Cys-tRNA(Pro) deacylase [Candidatus Pelagibacter sp. HIMB1321]